MNNSDNHLICIKCWVNCYKGHLNCSRNRLYEHYRNWQSKRCLGSERTPHRWKTICSSRLKKQDQSGESVLQSFLAMLTSSGADRPRECKDRPKRRRGSLRPMLQVYPFGRLLRELLSSEPGNKPAKSSRIHGLTHWSWGHAISWIFRTLHHWTALCLPIVVTMVIVNMTSIVQHLVPYLSIEMRLTLWFKDNYIYKLNVLGFFNVKKFKPPSPTFTMISNTATAELEESYLRTRGFNKVLPPEVCSKFVTAISEERVEGSYLSCEPR